MQQLKQGRKNMNRIILIGNGFDLAHGLKTSYKHFINDYWEKKTRASSVRLQNMSGFTDNILENFEDADIKVEFVGIPISLQGLSTKYAEGLKYKNLFLEQITEKNLKNWVDIEYEYYSALNDCLENKPKERSSSVSIYGSSEIKKYKGDIKQLNEEFSRIQEALTEYLKTQNVPNNAYSEEMMKKIFQNLTKQTDIDPDNYDGDKVLFLNFNYTDTTKFYQYEYPHLYNIIHIHGKLDNPENPIIFGYGDEMDEKSKLIENKNEQEYLVNNKSIRYLKTGNYQEMLAFIDANDYEIFVMGHSCGISDRTLLNTLFEHEHCKLIKPFYYEKDGKDNYEDIVINIYRNFKDKKRCRARVVNKKNCEALPQLV
jgi:hypothetical protein